MEKTDQKRLRDGNERAVIETLLAEGEPRANPDPEMLARRDRPGGC